MKNLILSLTLFTGFFSHAEIPGLASAYAGKILGVRSAISGMPIEGANSCNPQLIDMIGDGRIDITIALGYMDAHFENGAPMENSIYGSGDTLDIDARAALEYALTSACATNTFACGFRSRGSGRYTKSIANRFGGGNLEVSVTLANASHTSSDAQNQSSGAQTSQSQNAEYVFLAGFQTSDVVLYLGHARDGGGPDFYPPILNGDHVNYGAYDRSRVSSMAANLRAGQTPVVGLLACYSGNHFGGTVRSYSPGSMLISTGSLFDYTDIVASAYAIVEAVVSQRCLDDFSRVARAGRGSASLSIQ